jgi:hypothetical protein
MRLLPVAFALVFSASLYAADAADPLAKYSDENLAQIDFCFQKFCEAVARKDCAEAVAWLDEMPRNMRHLDPKKPNDQKSILAQMERFAGASLVSSQRFAIAKAGQVVYKTKDGKEMEQQMTIMRGRWKIANL